MWISVGTRARIRVGFIMQNLEPPYMYVAGPPYAVFLINALGNDCAWCEIDDTL